MKGPKPPSLAAVCQYLTHALEQYDQAKEDLKNALTKHQRASELTQEEINDVRNPVFAVFNIICAYMWYVASYLDARNVRGIQRATEGVPRSDTSL